MKGDRPVFIAVVICLLFSFPKTCCPIKGAFSICVVLDSRKYGFIAVVAVVVEKPKNI
jgi:hypothetical protein